MIRIFLLMTALCLTGCKLTLDGTNTGNPMATDPATSIGRNGIVALGITVCSKIQTCYAGANNSDCTKQIANIHGYTSELGATAAAYDTLTDLLTAETSNAVTVNETNYVNCKKAIEDLACSDTLMQTAYSVSTPTDYSATNLLFRSNNACEHIY
jgi:hypothetical protein